MYRGEIGGEFWDVNLTGSQSMDSALSYQGDLRYYLSGRSSLEAIIRDILYSKDCRTVYLPSYCCHTMIEPFLKHGLHVDSYEVISTKDGIKPLIDPNHSCDIFMFMNYFGYKMETLDLPKSAIVIYDITHRLCEEIPSNVNYAFASYRKWEAVPAASLALKLTGNWNLPDSKKVNDKYVEMRKTAFLQKQSFVNNHTNDKDIFLKTFSEAEKLLEKDYSGYSADIDSVQASKYIPCGYNQRRSNARFLLDNIHFNENLLPAFTEIHEDDTPLFFPVLVKREKRDDLRKHLIKYKIYCPVHWPLTDMHIVSDNGRRLFDEELSLICDQRYTVEDMASICKIINDYF